MPTTFISATTQETGDQVLTSDWWKLFDDPTLISLEETATAYNTDVKAAMSRVAEARAAAGVVGSAFYPTVNLDPSITRTGGPVLNGGNGSGRSTSTNIRLPIDLSYEVDLWGKIRRQVESADAQTRASVNDLHVVLHTLQADVALDYFSIRSLVSQEQILSRTVDSYRQQIELVQTQLGAGLVGPTDLYQAQVVFQSTTALQLEAHRQRLDVEHALAVLLGHPPSELNLSAEPLNLLPPIIPAGLPSDLLRRRPDVAEAEQNLISANADIGVAQSLFYPSISLTGALGFESIDVRHAFDWQQRLWSIGANASQPIFEGGQLKFNLELTKARYEELQSIYRGSVLGAIRDVEDSLTDLHYRADEGAAQTQAVQAAREYVRLSTIQYRQGLVGYLQVIDAERTLLANELSAAQVLNERLNASVLLIKALGGGWDATESPTTQPATTQPAGE